MKQSLILITLLCSLSQSVLGQQKKVNHYNQIWYAYNNNTRLTNRWGIWMDIQNKTKESFFDHFDIKENTLGAIYYLKNRIKLTGAFTYIQSYSNDKKPAFYAPEYRPWQMIQWKNDWTHTSLSHWIRLEERFKNKVINGDQLSDQYDFTYRLRYNIFSETPITTRKKQKGALAFVLADEIYFNYGKNIVYNSFDQNRLFGGFLYYFNTHDFLQFGYTNSFQHLATKSQFKSIDAIKLTFFNNLDFRKSNRMHKS